MGKLTGKWQSSEFIQHQITKPNILCACAYPNIAHGNKRFREHVNKSATQI